MRVIAHLFARLHQEERGSVLLVVIAFLPVAIGTAAFVIDVGNGAEHRRHLQMQADAGALAAAQELNGCFLNKAAANADVEAQALSYSGANHNPQIGAGDAQARVVTKINATTYDDPSYSEGTPCDTRVVDVKLIEEDSPPLFAFLSSADFRAHARVKAFTLNTAGNLLPVAVPDPDPKVAQATFFDEVTGTVLASTPLSQDGTSGGLSIWDNASALVDVPVTAEHIGVRIALGGGTSTTCGDPLVTCYEQGTNNAILHIRGWTAVGTATATAPIARSVSFLPGPALGGCPDPYFVNAAISCNVGLNAKIDFGSSPTALGATVSATFNGGSYPLTFNSATGTWSTAGAIPVPPNVGTKSVGLHWQVTKLANGNNCNGNACRGDITDVHRNFSASPDLSGQLGLAQVTEPGVTPVGSTSNTFERCSTLLTACTHKLAVKIGLKGGLALSTAGGPPVRLRVVGSGSQTQSLDCDPNISNLKSELAQGCNPEYRPHKATDSACPDSPSALWARANPPAWDCVAVQTGGATNQIAQGLNERVFGTTNPNSCTQPNHWPDWQPGDPRIIFVLVTPFGTLSGNGNTTVPVVRFATFYLTGWTGQGSGANPCIGHGDEAPSDAGEIVGRFISYVETPNTGGAGEATCDFSAIDPCVAVMVE
jgi:hypothetical protein